MAQKDINVNPFFNQASPPPPAASEILVVPQPSHTLQASQFSPSTSPGRGGNGAKAKPGSGGSSRAASRSTSPSPGEKSEDPSSLGKRTAVTLDRKHPLYSRMKYYNRLTPSAESSHHFRAPQHIVWGGISPYALFDASGKHGSFSTIFSIWNVMVGSGLLVMPWAFQNAGVIGGTLVLAVVGLACFYTAALIVEYSDGFDDFPDMVMRYFGSARVGKAAFYFASWSSVVMLLCVLVVYLTMISDFLFSVVSSIVLWSSGEHALAELHRGAASEFFSLKTVPLYMGLVLFPFTNLRDIGPLVKFNSFGIVAILYIIAFIVTRSATDAVAHPPQFHAFSDKWYYLAGIAMVSFFIHNAIIPIIRNKRTPTHNRRDLGIAFLLVFLTYSSCGIAGYLAFEHITIPQNFLNAYGYDDVLPFIARLALFLQLSGVYPLLAYIVRLQVFALLLSPGGTAQGAEADPLLAGDMSGAGGGPELVSIPDADPEAGRRRPARTATRSGSAVRDPRDPAFTPMSYMTLLNVYIMLQTVAVATWFPYIGTILRFTGCLTAAPYVWFLPIGVMWGLWKDRPPTPRWVLDWFWWLHTPLLLGAAGLAVLQLIP